MGVGGNGCWFCPLPWSTPECVWVCRGAQTHPAPAPAYATAVGGGGEHAGGCPWSSRPVIRRRLREQHPPHHVSSHGGQNLQQVGAEAASVAARSLAEHRSEDTGGATRGGTSWTTHSATATHSQQDRVTSCPPSTSCKSSTTTSCLCAQAGAVPSAGQARPFLLTPVLLGSDASSSRQPSLTGSKGSTSPT